MLKKIFKSTYIIAGIIVFLLLFSILFFAADTSFGESVLYSAILAVIGIVILWWKENVW